MYRMLLAVGILVYAAASISGAPEPDPKPDTKTGTTTVDKTAIGTQTGLDSAPDEPEPTPADHGFLVICNTNPERFVVLDSRGNWMPDIKEVNIKLQIGTNANVSCTSYIGLIEPTNPKQVTWKLLEMRSVSSDEFQTVIDNLQDDPAYLKSTQQ